MYRTYIHALRNAELKKTEVEIKDAGRNINHIPVYGLVVKSKEYLSNLWLKVR